MIKLQSTRTWILLCVIIVITGVISSNNGAQTPYAMDTSPWWDQKTPVMAPGQNKQQIQNTEMALISSDVNIFEILKETRDKCQGIDYTVKFYFQKDKDYFKIGSVTIDKNLFHKVLMKYSNWALTGQKIHSVNEEDEDIYQNDEPIDVKQTNFNNYYINRPKPTNNCHDVIVSSNDCHNSYDIEPILDNIRQLPDAKFEEVSDNNIKDNNYVNIKPNYNTKYNQYEAIIPEYKDKALPPTVINVFIDSNNNDDGKYSVSTDKIKNTMLDGKNKKYKHFHIQEGKEIILDDRNHNLINDLSDLKISELVDFFLNNNINIFDKDNPIIINFNNTNSSTIDSDETNTISTIDTAEHETNIYNELIDFNTLICDSDNVSETAPPLEYNPSGLEPSDFSDDNDTKIDYDSKYIITDPKEIDDANYYTLDSSCNITNDINDEINDPNSYHFDLTDGHDDPRVLTYDFIDPNNNINNDTSTYIQAVEPITKMVPDIAQTKVTQPVNTIPAMKFPKSHKVTPIIKQSLSPFKQPINTNLNLPLFPAIASSNSKVPDYPLKPLSGIPYSTKVPLFSLPTSKPQLPMDMSSAFKPCSSASLLTSSRENEKLLPIEKQTDVNPSVYFLLPSTLDTLAKDNSLDIPIVDMDQTLPSQYNIIPDISQTITKSPILTPLSMPELPLPQKSTLININNIPLTSSIAHSSISPGIKSAPLLPIKHNFPNIISDTLSEISPLSSVTPTLLSQKELNQVLSSPTSSTKDLISQSPKILSPSLSVPPTILSQNELNRLLPSSKMLASSTQSPESVQSSSLTPTFISQNELNQLLPSPKVSIPTYQTPKSVLSPSVKPTILSQNELGRLLPLPKLATTITQSSEILVPPLSITPTIESQSSTVAPTIVSQSELNLLLPSSKITPLTTRSPEMSVPSSSSIAPTTLSQSELNRLLPSPTQSLDSTFGTQTVTSAPSLPITPTVISQSKLNRLLMLPKMSPSNAQIPESILSSSVTPTILSQCELNRFLPSPKLATTTASTETPVLSPSVIPTIISQNKLNRLLPTPKISSITPQTTENVSSPIVTPTIVSLNELNRLLPTSTIQSPASLLSLPVTQSILSQNELNRILLSSTSLIGQSNQWPATVPSLLKPTSELNRQSPPQKIFTANSVTPASIHPSPISPTILSQTELNRLLPSPKLEPTTTITPEFVTLPPVTPTILSQKLNKLVPSPKLVTTSTPDSFSLPSVTPTTLSQSDLNRLLPAPTFSSLTTQIPLTVPSSPTILSQSELNRLLPTPKFSTLTTQIPVSVSSPSVTPTIISPTELNPLLPTPKVLTTTTQIESDSSPSVISTILSQGELNRLFPSALPRVSTLTNQLPKTSVSSSSVKPTITSQSELNRLLVSPNEPAYTTIYPTPLIFISSLKDEPQVCPFVKYVTSKPSMSNVPVVSAVTKFTKAPASFKGIVNGVNTPLTIPLNDVSFIPTVNPESHYDKISSEILKPVSATTDSSSSFISSTLLPSSPTITPTSASLTTTSPATSFTPNTIQPARFPSMSQYRTLPTITPSTQLPFIIPQQIKTSPPIPLPIETVSKPLPRTVAATEKVAKLPLSPIQPFSAPCTPLTSFKPKFSAFYKSYIPTFSSSFNTLYPTPLNNALPSTVTTQVSPFTHYITQPPLMTTPNYINPCVVSTASHSPVPITSSTNTPLWKLPSPRSSFTNPLSVKPLYTTKYYSLPNTPTSKPLLQYPPFDSIQYTSAEAPLVRPASSFPLSPVLNLPNYSIRSKLPSSLSFTKLPSLPRIVSTKYFAAPETQYATSYPSPINSIASPVLSPQYSPFVSTFYAETEPKLINSLSRLDAPLPITASVPPSETSALSPSKTLSKLSDPTTINKNIQPCSTEYITPITPPQYTTEYITPLHTITPKIAPQFSPFLNINYVSPKMKPYTPFSTLKLSKLLNTPSILPAIPYEPSLSYAIPSISVSAKPIEKSSLPPYTTEYVTPLDTISPKKTPLCSPFSSIKYVSPCGISDTTYVSPISSHIPVLTEPIAKSTLPHYTTEYVTPLDRISPKITPQFSPFASIKYVAPSTISDTTYNSPISSNIPAPAEITTISSLPRCTTEYVTPLNTISPKMTPQFSPFSNIKYTQPYTIPISSKLLPSAKSSYLTSPPCLNPKIKTEPLLSASQLPLKITSDSLPLNTHPCKNLNPSDKIGIYPIAPTVSNSPFITKIQPISTPLQYVTPLNTISQKTTPIKNISPCTEPYVPYSTPIFSKLLNPSIYTESNTPQYTTEYITPENTIVHKTAPQFSPFSNVYLQSKNMPVSIKVQNNPVSVLPIAALEALASSTATKISTPSEYITPTLPPQSTPQYISPIHISSPKTTLKISPSPNIKPSSSNYEPYIPYSNPTTSKELNLPLMSSTTSPVSPKVPPFSITTEPTTTTSIPQYTTEYITPCNTITSKVTPQFSPFLNINYISTNTQSYTTPIPINGLNSHINSKPGIPSLKSLGPPVIAEPVLPVRLLSYYTEYITPSNTTSPKLTPQVSPFTDIKYITPEIPYSTHISKQVPIPYYSAPISSNAIPAVSSTPQYVPKYVTPLKPSQFLPLSDIKYVSPSIQPYKTPISRKVLNAPIPVEPSKPFSMPYYTTEYVTLSDTVSTKMTPQISPFSNIELISPSSKPCTSSKWQNPLYIPKSTLISTKVPETPLPKEPKITSTPAPYYTTEYKTTINQIDKKITLQFSPFSNVNYISRSLISNEVPSTPATEMPLASISTPRYSTEYITPLDTISQKVTPQYSPFSNVNYISRSPTSNGVSSTRMTALPISPISTPQYSTEYITPVNTITQKITPQFSPFSNINYISRSPISNEVASTPVTEIPIAPISTPQYSTEYITPANTITQKIPPQYSPFSHVNYISRSPISNGVPSTRMTAIPISPISTPQYSTEYITPANTITQKITPQYSPFSHVNYISRSPISNGEPSTRVTAIPMSPISTPQYSTEYITPANTITQKITPHYSPFSHVNYISRSPISNGESSTRVTAMPISPIYTPQYSTEYITPLNTISQKITPQYSPFSNVNYISRSPNSNAVSSTPVTEIPIAPISTPQYSTEYITPLNTISQIITPQYSPFSNVYYNSRSPISNAVSSTRMTAIPTSPISTPQYSTEYITPANTITQKITPQFSPFSNINYISRSPISNEVPSTPVTDIPISPISTPQYSTEYITPVSTISQKITPQFSPFSHVNYISYSSVSNKVPSIPVTTTPTVPIYIPQYSTEYITPENTITQKVTPQISPFINVQYLPSTQPYSAFISSRVPTHPIPSYYNTPLRLNKLNSPIMNEPITPIPISSHTTPSNTVNQNNGHISLSTCTYNKLISPRVPNVSTSTASLTDYTPLDIPTSKKPIYIPLKTAKPEITSKFVSYSPLQSHVLPFNALVPSKWLNSPSNNEILTPTKTAQTSSKTSPFSNIEYNSPSTQSFLPYTTPISPSAPVFAESVRPIPKLLNPSVLPELVTSPSLKYYTEYVTPSNTISPKVTPQFSPFSNVKYISHFIPPYDPGSSKGLNIPTSPFYSSPILLNVPTYASPQYTPEYITPTNQNPKLSPFSNLNNIPCTPVSRKVLYPSLTTKYITSTPYYTTEYQTPLDTVSRKVTPQICPFTNVYYMNNLNNHIPSQIKNNTQPLQNIIKTNLNNYINNNKGFKSELYTSNANINIPLGNIIIAKTGCINTKLQSKLNPNINLKAWPSNVKMVEANLQLKFKELSITNFQPIVCNLSQYDLKNIEVIVKNYIENKYGNVIVAENNYSLHNEYELIKNCGYVDNKCNLLWPVATCNQCK